MVIHKYFLSLFFIFVYNFTNAQLYDNDFKSLSLPKTFKQVQFMMKKSKWLSTNKDSIILFNQLFVVKINGEYYYTDSLLIKDNCTSGLPNLMYDFIDGTKCIFVGAALNDRLEQRKDFKCISIRIDSLPPIGDTAIFEFYLLSFFDNHDLQPQVYFSEKLIPGNKGNFYNFKNFNYVGRLFPPSTSNKDLVLSKISLPITKESVNYNWIHLITDYNKRDLGFVIARDLKLTKKKSANSKIIETQNIVGENIHIFFNFDSYELLNLEKEKLDSVYQILKNNKNISVELQGVADRIGNLEYNLILANNRALSVKKYFNQIGLSDINIDFLPPIIGVFSDEILNRTCLVRLINN